MSHLISPCMIYAGIITLRKNKTNGNSRCEALYDLRRDNNPSIQVSCKSSKAIGKLINMKKRDNEMSTFENFIQGTILRDESL